MQDSCLDQDSTWELCSKCMTHAAALHSDFLHSVSISAFRSEISHLMLPVSRSIRLEKISLSISSSILVSIRFVEINPETID
jgi:hypothetical protein